MGGLATAPPEAAEPRPEPGDDGALARDERWIEPSHEAHSSKLTCEQKTNCEAKWMALPKSLKASNPI